jgi:hypothetical protein
MVTAGLRYPIEPTLIRWIVLDDPGEAGACPSARGSRRETGLVAADARLAISTIERLRTDDVDRRPRRQWWYTATTAALTALIGLAVVDGFGWVDAFGVDTTRVHAASGGYELEVRYATVSRPALATPFAIDVSRAEGFDGPVTIAVSRAYLAMWDANGMTPSPSAETADREWVYWEFDPPPGDTLTFVYDARIEPSAQSGRDGAVAIVDDEDRQIVAVEFHTAVRP